MSSSVPASAGGVVVFTQVYPPHQQEMQQVCVGAQRFSRVHPLAVGTVQIMIGVLVFLLGIVMVIHASSLGVFSGIFVWGAAFYITSGALTVAAGKSFGRCVLNTSLAFNVVSSVVALMAMIMYCLDAAGLFMYCRDSRPDYDCYMYATLSQGFSGVLAVFHLLELIVSITVSAFACKATCNCDGQQPQVYVIPGSSSLATHAPPPSNATPVSTVHPPPQVMSFPKTEGQVIPGLTEPPAYSS